MLPMPFLFVHIPKTGGMSIRHLLETKFNYSVIPSSIDHEGYANPHDPLYRLELANLTSPDTFVFTVCRNPYRRMYSYYRYLKEGGQMGEVSFEDWLKHIDSLPASSTKQYKYCQGRWLVTSRTYPKKYVYRFENLKEFEDHFQVKLPHKNKSSFCVEEYSSECTEIAKRLVFEIYWEDFLTFGYSRHWEDSLPAAQGA